MNQGNLNAFDTRRRTMLLTRSAFVVAGTVASLFGIKNSIDVNNNNNNNNNYITQETNRNNNYITLDNTQTSDLVKSTNERKLMVQSATRQKGAMKIDTISSTFSTSPTNILSTSPLNLMIDNEKVIIPEKTKIFHIPPKDNIGNYDINFYNDNDTIFGKILRGDEVASTLYETNTLFVFQDNKPRAELHGLIIPKKRINSVLQLTSEDLPMLYEMKKTAEIVIKQYCINDSNNTFDINDYKLVFHIPPFYSVKHLHLHVLAPVHKMEWFYKKWKYPDTETRWCTQLDNVIKRLEQNKKPVPYNLLHYSYKGSNSKP